jgi:hypothetical protein
MRRRKLRWVVAGLAVLLLVTGAFAAWPRPDRITEENAGRITRGMSRAEVYAILGPPGDYRTVLTEDPIFSGTDFGPAVVEFTSGPQVVVNIPRIPSNEETLVWNGDGGDISVRVGAGGVVSKHFMVMEKVAQSPLDNLLWRAKRQWRKWFPGK